MLRPSKRREPRQDAIGLYCYASSMRRRLGGRHWASLYSYVQDWRELS